MFLKTWMHFKFLPHHEHITADGALSTADLCRSPSQTHLRQSFEMPCSRSLGPRCRTSAQLVALEVLYGCFQSCWWTTQWKSVVRQKKNLNPLSKYFSFSISILSAWENPMKLFLRDGTDTNLFTPLGGSHRPFLTQASRKDVLHEWQSKIRGQPTSQLTFQSCHTWNLEKLQTYS